MALVFWKPSERVALNATLKDLFAEINNQDQQTERWSIKPFFDSEKIHQKKIVFVSDYSNQIDSIERYLEHIHLVRTCFEKALRPKESNLFFSLRDKRSESKLLSSPGQILTMLQSSFDCVHIPPPPLPKISMSATYGMRLSPKEISNSKVFSTISHSLLQQPIYWPKIFLEADYIIPINYFHASNTFIIHGILSSFFYCLPSTSQSMILIQSNIKNRSLLFVEYLRTILSKVPYSVIISGRDPAFVLISNDSLSADTFSSALGSIRALSVPLSYYANKQKLGLGDITKINLIGPKFVRPLYQLENNSILNKKNSLKCLDARCILCDQCMNSCPVAAWERHGNRYQWLSSLCNRCGHCIDICPANAIQILSKGVVNGTNFSD